MSMRSRLLFIFCGIFLLPILVIRIPSSLISNIGGLLFIKKIVGCRFKPEMIFLHEEENCVGNNDELPINIFNMALKIDKSNSSATLYQGLSHLFSGDPDKAYITFYNQTIHPYPVDVVNVYWLAWAAYINDQPKEAIKYWGDIQAWRSLNDIAKIFYQEGKTAEALLWYRNTLDVLSNSKINNETYVGLGAVNYSIATIYYDQQEISSAIPYYQAAVDYMPGRVDYTYQLAMELKQLGMFEKAQEVLLKAIDIHPTNAILCGSLGEVYLGMDNWSAAESTLYHCQDMERDKYWKARILFDLSLLDCKTNNYELCLIDTITSVDTLQILDPGWEYQIGLNFDIIMSVKQTVETYISIGDFYIRYGKVDEAVRIFQRAEILWPEDTIIKQHLLQIMPAH